MFSHWSPPEFFVTDQSFLNGYMAAFVPHISHARGTLRVILSIRSNMVVQLLCQGGTRLAATPMPRTRGKQKEELASRMMTV